MKGIIFPPLSQVKLLLQLMLKLHVLMTKLSKQQRFPGEVHKKRTNLSWEWWKYSGPNKGSWGRVGSLSVRWESGASRQITCEGEMEMILHSKLQSRVWDFQWSIHKWNVFAEMESWIPLTYRLSSLPPPCSALCPRSFRFACLFFFVMNVCLYSSHLTCSLFLLVLLLQV